VYFAIYIQLLRVDFYVFASGIDVLPAYIQSLAFYIHVLKLASRYFEIDIHVFLS